MFGDLFGNIEAIKKMAMDPEFRAFLTNPKVQRLMMDEDFKKAVQEKNVLKLMQNRDFAELMQDPEVRDALIKINEKHKKNI